MLTNLDTRKMTRDELEVLSKAFSFAMRAHAGQERKSGEPYFAHPVRVALNVLKIGLDAESVAAAVLHDVVEDTDITMQEIVETFGITVASIVGVLTKPKSGTPDRESQYKEQLLAGPIEAQVIKLLDIEDNIHDAMEFFPPKKAKEYIKDRTQLADELKKSIASVSYR